MKQYRNTTPRKNKLVVITSCLAFLFAVLFVALFIHDGYHRKIISRLSPKNEIVFQSSHADRAVDGWHNCLNQLHVKADIAFFGDSITRRGNFADFFPDKTICNLGLGSDTLVGMADRVSMIDSISPNTLFIMGGINSLRDNTLHQSIREYDELLSRISDLNAIDVYLISVLPISANKAETLGISSETITSFNNSIFTLSAKYGFSYVDLYSLFTNDEGNIKPDLTTDGVHLTDKGYDLWFNAITGFVSVE